MFVYELIYKKILKLVPHLFTLKIGTGLCSKAGSYMDLHLNILQKEDNFIVIALSHTYLKNGDKVADPDMEIKVYTGDNKMAEALTYQDYICYQVVYPKPNYVNLKLKNDLNRFLNMWLSNCINQGHSFIKK